MGSRQGEELPKDTRQRLPVDPRQPEQGGKAAVEVPQTRVSLSDGN